MAGGMTMADTQAVFAVLRALAALGLQLAGFGFLLAAAIGVLRFADPLQRMHAATKAGTVGAGLTVAGAALARADGATLLVAALTIEFLVFTVPLAGHLLGRAIYASGIPWRGLKGADALDRALRRGESPEVPQRPPGPLR